MVVFAGYDVPAASGSGLSAFTPCSSQRPEASEHFSHQWRTDQTGRLWSGSHIQFSDGAHFSGKSDCAALINLTSWLYKAQILVAANKQLQEKSSEKQVFQVIRCG